MGFKYKINEHITTFIDSEKKDLKAIIGLFVGIGMIAFYIYYMNVNKLLSPEDGGIFIEYLIEVGLIISIISVYALVYTRKNTLYIDSKLKKITIEEKMGFKQIGKEYYNFEDIKFLALQYSRRGSYYIDLRLTNHNYALFEAVNKDVVNVYYEKLLSIVNYKEDSQIKEYGTLI